MHGPGPEVAAPAEAAAGGGYGAGYGARYGAMMLTSLVVLVLVCVAAWVALRLVARWLGGRRVGGGGLFVVRVVARVPLEPRRALYVVEAGGRRLLIGSSEGGVSLVTELAAEPVEAENRERAPAPRRSFAEMLALAVSRRRPS